MDDDLESPSALPVVPTTEIPAEDAAELSEEEEDGGLDWTKLLYVQTTLSEGPAMTSKTTRHPPGNTEARRKGI